MFSVHSASGIVSGDSDQCFFIFALWTCWVGCSFVVSSCTETCRMCSSILGLSPLVLVVLLPLFVECKCPQTYSMLPGQQAGESPLAENHCYRRITHEQTHEVEIIITVFLQMRKRKHQYFVVHQTKSQELAFKLRQLDSRILAHINQMYTKWFTGFIYVQYKKVYILPIYFDGSFAEIPLGIQCHEMIHNT